MIVGNRLLIHHAQMQEFAASEEDSDDESTGMLGRVSVYLVVIDADALENG